MTSMNISGVKNNITSRILHKGFVIKTNITKHTLQNKGIRKTLGCRCIVKNEWKVSSLEKQIKYKRV